MLILIDVLIRNYLSLRDYPTLISRKHEDFFRDWNAGKIKT